MKELIGYKVMREGFFSRIQSVGEFEGGIKYILNKWVEPRKKFGPLSVFTSRKFAIEFARSLPSGYKSIIYKSKYVKSKNIMFQDYSIGGKRYTYHGMIPRGTDFASKVMLIGRCHI